MPVDWAELAAVIMGTAIILIPVAGFTARFALKPIVEAVATYRGVEGMSEDLEVLDRRLSLLEQQQAQMESELTRLQEAVEFHDRLGAGESEDG